MRKISSAIRIFLLTTIFAAMAIFIPWGIEAAEGDTQNDGQTRSQLQEELGEALRHYYIYGDNKQECDRLLELIENI